MSSTQTSQAAPRRVRVEPNIYRQPNGSLEVGFKDGAGKQRWRTVPNGGGILKARALRNEALAARGRGERVAPNPRLRFGEAADRWLAGPVQDLRPTTQARYRNAVEQHLRPRYGTRRLDAIDADTAASLVRELRAGGAAEASIVKVLGVLGSVCKYAARRLGWAGVIPTTLLLPSERPKLSDSPERRIYEGDELAQTLAASWEPWTTLFRLASVVGGRESELLGLWWENLSLDLDAATVTFTHQVDRHGERVPLKTEESKATLPLPRATATMLLAHKLRSRHTGPQAFVFATSTGRPLGQRNVLRALYRAQEAARDANGLPTFPDLYEHDEHGHLTVDDHGAYMPRNTPRRELPPLPDFHALRHGAAMDCQDAEEARDLLRHKNSNVTRAIYRAHFSDQRRESLRARMEARMEASAATTPLANDSPLSPEMRQLQG